MSSNQEHTAENDAPRLLTRRGYLQLKAMETDGVSWSLAVEAVASIAIEHPEWDMDERKTWDEWTRVIPPENDAPAVTSVEPGCTCGGMAACPQCQERDAAAARVIPPDEGDGG